MVQHVSGWEWGLCPGMKKKKNMGVMTRGLNERCGFEKATRERMAEEILSDISTVPAKRVWGGGVWGRRAHSRGND